MSGAAVVLDNVRRSFDGKIVLQGISARAERGRVIGLLGRNGEGKTTLMRILLDLLAADSGGVEVLGRSPDGSGQIRGLVGWVPERPAFPESFDAAEVLAWRERFFPRWDRERARRLASLLSLDPATPMKGASKGTLCKLAWVCALAHDPELYLLDEPTSGLDVIVRRTLLTVVLPELRASGKTILLADHYMEAVSSQLDELWILRGGRLAVSDAGTARGGFGAADLSRLLEDPGPM